MVKRAGSFAVSILAAVMLFMISVSAAVTPTVMESYTGDESVTLYIRGEADYQKADVQIGTAEAKVTKADQLKDEKVPMRTLVMLDNSLSITNANRTKIKDFLTDLISDRTGDEEIRLATFDKDVQYLTDYTNDYSVLKKAVDGIKYEDKDTYLTDVLYDVLQKDVNQEEGDVFRRIIIISDGVDNKAIGYTKDELTELLKEHTYLIYALGSVGKNNNEKLESMFSLSRLTNASYYLLDDVQDMLSITSELKKDQDIVRLQIKPDSGEMDGEVKSVKITAGEEVLTAEARMPQQKMEEKPVEEQPEVTPEPEETPEPEPVEEEKLLFGILPLKYAVIGGAAAAVFLIILIIAIILIKKEKKKNTFETIDDAGPANEAPEKIDPTVFIGNDDSSNDHDDTIGIWNEQKRYRIILTDINSPSRSYDMPCSRSMVIGRTKAKGCQLVIDNDKAISSRHCQLSVKNGRFFLRDLGSSNGTYINGNKIITEQEIVSGNIIKMGRSEFRFEIR